MFTSFAHFAARSTDIASERAMKAYTDSHIAVTGCKYYSYYFKYPFSRDPESTAYEIDKKNKCYLALDAKLSKAEQDPLAAALTDLDLHQRSTTTLLKWEDTKETIKFEDIDFEMKRIEYVSSQMIIFGDVDCVRGYLDSSAENEFLINGIDRSGKTAL